MAIITCSKTVLTRHRLKKKKMKRLTLMLRNLKRMSRKNKKKRTSLKRKRRRITRRCMLTKIKE